jgi:hypothetical protein
MHEQVDMSISREHGSQSAAAPVVQSRERPASALMLSLVLLVNAAVMLFFEYFITVDGPVHVLQASLLKATSATAHMAHGMTYDPAMIRPWLGHGILMILLQFSTPAQAHDLFAAFVGCAVIVSMIALLRAHGTRWGPAFLWFAPVTFNILLLMGLFNFLLGVAISIGTLAWWISRAGSERWRYGGLFLGALLAWNTHRSAPLLICLVFLPTLLFGMRAWIKGHTGEGRASANRRIRPAVFVFVLVFLALAIHQAAPGIQLPIANGLPPLNMELLSYTPSLSIIGIEAWSTHAMGVLLLISFCAAAWVRWHMGGAMHWHDPYLALFIGFSIASWLFHSPQAQRLLLMDRAGWLALVFLLIWIVAMASTRPGWPRQVIIGAALCALPLHAFRMVKAAVHFSELRPAHEFTMEAGKALLPGSMVLSVVEGPERSAQNLKAYVAMEHDGILLSLGKRFPIRSLTSGVGVAWLHQGMDPHWIMRKWRDGMPPEVDHVLFLGYNNERRVNSHPWNKLLPPHFTLTFSNGYTQVYTRPGIIRVE